MDKYDEYNPEWRGMTIEEIVRQEIPNKGDQIVIGNILFTNAGLTDDDIFLMHAEEYPGV